MSSPKLPAALAKNAALVARRAVAAHEARARELIASINGRRSEVAGSFWDIGRDLGELREKRIYSSVGYDSFEQLTQQAFGMSVDTAHKLVSVASHYQRSQAVLLGQERAAALLLLAEARGEADTVSAIARGSFTIPGRKGKVRATELSANELKRAAREVRAARKHGAAALRASLKEATDLAATLAMIEGVSAKAKLVQGVPSVTVTFAVVTGGAVSKVLRR